jgi:beta-glucanase (GH16 family)
VTRAGLRRTPPRRSLPVLIATALALAGVLLGVRLATPQTAAKWAVVWSDSFAGPAGAGVSQRSWTYQTGHGIFGNGEIETATSSPANVRLDGSGALEITAEGHGTSWTSGRIRSSRVFLAPAGDELMVTASIRQPDPAVAAGYWPAFWLLGPGTWPAHGEIDIMEDANGLSEHSGALHCGNLTAANPDGTFGPCHEQDGLGSGLLPCPGCQQGYHRYTVIIDRRDAADQQVRWYLDGRQFFTVSESQVGAAAWRTAFDQGFAIILDLAIGGMYPDAACRCSAPSAGTTSGGTLSVRDVAVYLAS